MKQVICSQSVLILGIIFLFVGFHCTPNPQEEKEAYADSTYSKREPLILELKHIKNDSLPFCVFVETSDLSKASFPPQETLRFLPEELREISTSDYLLHLNTQTPFLSRKNDNISFLLGRDFSGNPVISFDTDNDGKFATEKVYNLNDKLPLIPIENLKYYITDTPSSRTIYIRPKKRIHRYGVDLTSLHAFLYDTVNLNGSLYKIALASTSKELFFPLTARSKSVQNLAFNLDQTIRYICLIKSIFGIVFRKTGESFFSCR